MASPTRETLQRCRANGWTAQVVEQWNSHIGVRQDLFGNIDVIACVPAGPPPPIGDVQLDVIRPAMIVGIQCTSRTNVSSRMRKALQTEQLGEWLRCGGHFWIWGWGRMANKGPDGRWIQCREEVITLEDWEAATDIRAEMEA